MRGRFSTDAFGTAGLILILLGVVLRVRGVWFLSGDMTDALFVWYRELAVGGFGALRTGFYIYTPPYLYLLWLATWTRSAVPPIVAIKGISILFDVGSGIWVYKILRVQYREGTVPFFGASVFFVLPTIVINSAWWGQCDSIFTFFVLACFYALLRDRSLTAMVYFGIAFAFKLQAIFFAPFLLMLILKRRIAWHHSLAVPLAYVVLMVPAVWAGRPAVEALEIYIRQAREFHALSLKAPNLYHFISADWYSPALVVGVGLTGSLALVWAVGCARKISALTPEVMAACAAVSVAMMPFFLPKMHERYFYLADVMLLLLAFSVPRLWFLPLAAQVISTLTYSAYLFLPASQAYFPFVTKQLLVTTAAVLNSAVMAFLVGEQYRLIRDAPTTS
jgi:Gpi18-like mannosyltransferase